MDETTLIPRERLLALVRLPATAELRECLGRLQSRKTTAPGATSASLIREAERRVADGEERDRLRSQRPNGCVCLGLGTVPWSLVDDRGFCGCSDGIAARADNDCHLAAVRATDVAAFVARARIPKRFAECTFDTFRGDGSVLHKLRSMVDEDQFSAFLYGSYGCGKTGLAVSLIREWIERHCKAGLFVTSPSLLASIRATYAPDSDVSEARLLEWVKSVPFLVLDDLGAEKSNSWVTEKLFTIINHRHDEELPTAFTSNLTLDELAGRIGDRTSWRIAEMCKVVEVIGRNLREQRK